MISKTMTARPAAGPLTWRGEPARKPTTMPPMMPVRIPAAGGAPGGKAMPMQRGSATRKTTREAERSLTCFGLIGIAEALRDHELGAGVGDGGGGGGGGGGGERPPPAGVEFGF